MAAGGIGTTLGKVRDDATGEKSRTSCSPRPHGNVKTDQSATIISGNEDGGCKNCVMISRAGRTDD